MHPCTTSLTYNHRIKRSDGLIRLVPGLGTRAVDRVGDDYPILSVPGQPGLRVNTTIDEVIRYSPRSIDASMRSNASATPSIPGASEAVRSAIPSVVETVVSELERVGRPPVERDEPGEPDLWWE